MGWQSTPSQQSLGVNSSQCGDTKEKSQTKDQMPSLAWDHPYSPSTTSQGSSAGAEGSLHPHHSPSSPLLSLLPLPLPNSHRIQACLFRPIK